MYKGLVSFLALCQEVIRIVTFEWNIEVEKLGLKKVLIFVNCYNPSHKSLDTLRGKPSPASPHSVLLQWCRHFFWVFFRTCKTTLGRGNGGKGSHCPMFLSEIVWTRYAKYVVSFYVMWISDTLAESRHRGRCFILNKIIKAATAVKLHWNWCSLNHVGMNL